MCPFASRRPKSGITCHKYREHHRHKQSPTTFYSQQRGQRTTSNRWSTERLTSLNMSCEACWHSQVAHFLRGHRNSLHDISHADNTSALSAYSQAPKPVSASELSGAVVCFAMNSGRNSSESINTTTSSQSINTQRVCKDNERAMHCGHRQRCYTECAYHTGRSHRRAQRQPGRVRHILP